MKIRLTVVVLILVGFSACAPKYTCPAYATEKGKEIKAEKVVQAPM